MNYRDRDFAVWEYGSLFDSIRYVPRATEQRIRLLCKEISVATTKAEVERILPELRAALKEHIRLAKDSLELQAKVIALLDEFASKDPAKPNPEMAAD